RRPTSSAGSTRRKPRRPRRNPSPLSPWGRGVGGEGEQVTGSEIITVLEEKFGERIRAKKPDALDPWAVVVPSDLLDVCRYPGDEPRLRFDMLNCISGVDYLEPDPKKAPKAGFEPHTEVVYHLSSFAHPGQRFVLKMILPRWKDDKPGELPEVPSV